MQPIHGGFGAPIDINKLYGQPKQQQKPVKPQTRGRGGFLSSLISELGGAGGAAGGAAAGAAAGSVIPGLGTVIGGLIGAGVGGFAGGTAGRAVENKVRDNQNFLGKGGSAKSAYTEGILSGALSTLGMGAKPAYQGFKGLVKGPSAIEQLAKESGTALQAGEKVGIIQGAGQQLKAGAGGYGIGSKLGSNPLTVKESNRIANALKTLQVGASSPENMARSLGSKISNLEQIMTNQYASANSTISRSELSNLQKNISKRIANEVGTPDNKFIGSRLQALRGSKDINGIWDFNKNLSKFTNYGANAEGKLVDREAAARIMKDETRKFLNAKVPGVKQTNELYHGAKDAESLALKSAADIKGGGLVAKVTTLSPVRAAEAKIGGGLEKVGKASAGTGGFGTKVTQQAKFQSPLYLAEAISNANKQAQQPANFNPQDIFGQNGANDTSNAPSLMNETQSQFEQDLAANNQNSYGNDTQPTSLQDALLQAKQIVGEGQKPSVYLDYAKEIMSANKKSSSNGPNVGKLSAQNYLLAKSGADSLNQLASIIQSDPSVINRSGTPGQGLPVVGGLIQRGAGTGDYKALANNVIDTLLRVRTGAQANNEEVALYSRALVPQAGDSPATIKRKLNQLYAAYQDTLNLAGGQ